MTPGCGEGKCGIYCRAPSKECRKLMYKGKGLNSLMASRERVWRQGEEEGCRVCDQLGEILLMGGEIIRSQHHQPSGSDWSGVYMLVDGIQLASSVWWRFFSVCKNSWNDMAQNILYRPWEGAQGSCLFSGWTIILLSCLTVFFCYCIFSLLFGRIKWILCSLGKA